MQKTHSFGYLVRRLRLALDLTQAALAQQVGCATITIRKIEADERRPSRQMAMLLADSLGLAGEEREEFVAAGLGEGLVDRLTLPREPAEPEVEESRPAWLEKAVHVTRGQAELGFVGREQELAQMGEHLRAALAGDGRVIFVSGEAGQGKTALMAEFARRAQKVSSELIVAQGYGAATAGMGHAYLPFRDILVSLSGDLEARWQAGLVSAEQADRLWRFAPMVAQTIVRHGPQLLDALVPAQSLQRVAVSDEALGPDEPPAQRDYGEREGQQSQLFEQLTAVLQKLARERPLLLLLDDLQWIDAASASLLFHVGRRLAGSRILIAGAYRPSQVASESGGRSMQTLQEAILEFSRLFGDNHVDLQKLDTPTARQLTGALLDREPNKLEESFRVKLFWQTRGNPLFVSELLREMRARGHLVKDGNGYWVEGNRIDWDTLPSRVTAVIEQRLARLGKEERWVLDIASVEGERFTVAIVAQLTGYDEVALLRLLGAMEEQHGLVEELGELHVGTLRLSRFQFSHVLFQHYLYEALGRAQRRRLHGDIGDRLATLHEADTDTILPELAHHFEAAGREKEAIAFLIRAGDKARTVYATEEARNHFERAIALCRKTDDREKLARTLIKLGLTHQTAFDYERAQEAFDEAFLEWSRAMPATPVAGDDGVSALLQATRPLRMVWQEPSSLDPTMGGYNLTAPLAAQIFSGLVAFGPESEIVPDVAHSWEISDGGRRYLFHLRDDVLWSDGAPVTAHDFEFTYRRALDPATGAHIAGMLLAAVKGAADYHPEHDGNAGTPGVRALDDHMLEIELQEPTSYFIYNLAYYVLLPTPRHVVEVHGASWANSEHIVTNGPFRLVAWEPGKSIHLQRNAHYHGIFEGNVERVYLVLEEDPKTHAALYAADQLDIVSNWFTSYPQLSHLQQRYRAEYVRRRRFSTLFYYLDTTQPPFDDRRMRRALALALDREALAEVYLRGYVEKALGGFVPPDMPGHVADCGVRFDPQRARQLWQEASNENGYEVSRIMVHTSAFAEDLVAFLKDGWSRVLDVEVEARVIRVGEESQAQESDPAPVVFMGGWWADYPDPDNFLRVCVDPSEDWWYDARYADLLQRAARITDQAERLSLYREAELILAREAPLLPLAYSPLHLMIKPRVKRYPTSAVKSPGFWKDVVVEIGD